MKSVIKISLIIVLFISIFSMKPYCKKLKIVSSTVQKTIPGFRGADIREKYIFVCKKQTSKEINIDKLWIGNAKKGRYIDFELYKFEDDKLTNEKLSSLSGTKIFAIVGTYKYPADLANKPIKKSNDECPIKDFKGASIIKYTFKSKTKDLIVTEIKKLKDIRRR